ncbi:deoxyribose-phosphate aldolase [Paenibacillus swuensis]|uniref:Deoxyribose-phosphate aldolase n=1 Tax=Paenibacillus swuensis TaxID=1178515 RepID=A0A172TJS2_9BACL|nr:deoxyribose-phosphate aldolase [Paenibacillus swuensis]ANE47301.1 deoxyribose-phosphate aldolase [Paenibacillus swuensis]
MSNDFQKEITQYIDHTLLKAEAKKEDIEKLCQEAKEHHFFSVCVNSQWVSLCAELLKGSNVKVCTVVGFPLGASTSETKALEAAKAVEQGALEVDMVLAIGSLISGDYDYVRDDIRKVVQAVEGKAIVKVIMETGYLNDDQKKIASKLSEEAGAHFIKTSTGFGKGGATVEDITLMRGSVSDHIGVKASGGVRDLETAKAMIAAGATRLGTSSGVVLAQGGKSTGGY